MIATASVATKRRLIYRRARNLTFTKQDYSTIIKKGTGNVIDFTLNNKNVSYAPEIYISLTTKRDWHRFHNVDDIIKLNYGKILPPVEDTY